MKKIGSWNGAAGQRIPEPGNRGIAIVRNRYQEISSDYTAGCKRLGVCSSDL
jgi:hypothetical protein